MYRCGIIILLFWPALLQAQKTYNMWAFGVKGGLNFNTDPVSVFASKADGIAPPYYMTSVCDQNGQLKFYTDGLKVWNRDHFKMPVFNNWWPWSDTIMPLAVPHIGKDSMYYLFGISNGLNAGKLIYLNTMMHNPGDLEEVVYPRPINQTSYYTTLTANASMLLAGTAHCNQNDIWIVVHKPGQMEAFLISAAGVSANPVVSPLSFSSTHINGGYSNIKFSANGEKLVVPDYLNKRIVVLRFNNQTGVFTEDFIYNLPLHQDLEDVEISPDGSMLYFATTEVIEIDPGEPGPDMHFIYQMNLRAGSPSQIISSKFTVNGFGDRVACIRTCIMMKRTMQLGPDGRIYIGMRFTGSIPNIDLTMSVIEFPNKQGPDAVYRKNFIDVKRMYRFINYNYIRSSSFSLKENGIQVKKKTCMDKPVEFSLLFHEVDSVRWNFGDPSSNSLNHSSSLNPQHLYPGEGTYLVSAVIYKNCKVDTAFREVAVTKTKAISVPAFIADTVICKGTKLTLDVTTATATAYQWENGLIYPTRTLDTAGRYSVTVFNECSSDAKSFSFRYDDCPCNVFVPNAFTPNNDGLNDLFKPIVQCAASNYSFRVFNRWGGIVFHTNDRSKAWDGKLNSNLAASDVYVWVVQYKLPSTGESKIEKGTVMLIR